jgi:hypothetical protein
MYFEVRIFPTVEDLRRHHTLSSVLSIGVTNKAAFASEALAMCCPRTEWTVNRRGEVTYVNPRIGYLLFAADRLEPRIVAHELVHAALTFYRERGRDTNWRRANFGSQATENEETLAYIYDGLFREMNLKLHDRGYWSEAA